MTDSSLNRINKLKEVYNKYFSLHYIGETFNDRMALISMLGYISFKIKQNKPMTQTYDIIKKINSEFPDDVAESLSVVVDDFCYGLRTFETFGLDDKEILKAIKRLLLTYLPF